MHGHRATDAGFRLLAFHQEQAAVMFDHLILPQLQHLAGAVSQITEGVDIFGVPVFPDGLPDLLHFDVAQGFPFLRLPFAGVQVFGFDLRHDVLVLRVLP